jgi:putative membrane protein
MITDHSKANDELKQIASTKGAVVPSELSHRENATIERFEKLSGREFEKEYVEHMVKDHKKDAKDFEDAVKDVKDPELKAFAQKTLSVIQQHLRSVQDLQTSVKS